MHDKILSQSIVYLWMSSTIVHCYIFLTNVQWSKEMLTYIPSRCWHVANKYRKNIKDTYIANLSKFMFVSAFRSEVEVRDKKRERKIESKTELQYSIVNTMWWDGTAVAVEGGETEHQEEQCNSCFASQMEGRAWGLNNETSMTDLVCYWGFCLAGRVSDYLKRFVYKYTCLIKVLHKMKERYTDE